MHKVHQIVNTAGRLPEKGCSGISIGKIQKRSAVFPGCRLKGIRYTSHAFGAPVCQDRKDSRFNHRGCRGKAQFTGPAQDQGPVSGELKIHRSIVPVTSIAESVSVFRNSLHISLPGLQLIVKACSPGETNLLNRKSRIARG